MLENTNTKQFYPGPILNRTLEITKFLFRNPEQVRLQKTALDEYGKAYDIELTYGTDYEVQKVLPNDINIEDANLTASTGQITLKSTVEVKEGEKLTAYRESALVQDTDYPRTGKFPAASHEGALDYLTMQNQEQQDQIDRSLKIPVSIQNFNAQMPIPLPAKALKINATGDGFEMSEYDPDIALDVTKEYAQNAQNAANAALASQSAAASSSQNATEQATIATTQATIATEQAAIATSKASEVVESGNAALSNISNAKTEALGAITAQETTSKNNVETKGAEQIELIQNEGATQVANVQSTGFYLRDDKLYFINSQGEETEFKSGGSGLEVGDISMALYVNEADNLRRYLNGQIIDNNKNTKVFIEDYLLGLYATNPEYFTTEDNWQAEALLNIDGCVYKFVLNYADDGETIISVRLPKYPDYVEIDAGSLSNSKIPVTSNQTLGSRRISIPCNNKINGTYKVGSQDGSGDVFTYGDFDTSIYWYANTSNIGINKTKLKLRYFIQIATGSETENNIVNDIELNNPYSLFDSKYSDHELNNLSWLKSNGQWNAKAVYPEAYDKLLKVYNGTETVEGLSVKLSTEDYTNYDFVLNTSDETFRLPLSNNQRFVIETYTDGTNGYRIWSDGYCEQWGKVNSGVTVTFIKTFKDTNYNLTSALIDTTSGATPTWGQMALNSRTANGFKINSGGATQLWKASGYLAEGEYTSQNLNLYFYVGETVQNANLIDAGRIGEQLANKQDKCIHIIDTYENGASGYRIWSDGYCEQWGAGIGSTSYNANNTVTLLKSYKDTNYNISVVANAETNIDTFARLTGYRSVNAFGVCTGYGSTTFYAYHILWKTCGYLAKGEY